MFGLIILACSAGKEIDTSHEESVNPILGENYSDDIAKGCHESVNDWMDLWHDIEVQTLEEINKRREQPADCRTQGSFDPAPPLKLDPYLHCSSRFHSYWMGQNGALEHDSPGGALGEDPWQRIESTGFPGYATGENVAAGYDNPVDVVDGWMSSDGHCSIIMSPDSTHAGVGFYFIASGWEYYWTLNTGLYE